MARCHRGDGEAAGEEGSRPGWAPRRARPRGPGRAGLRLFVAIHPPVPVADALRAAVHPLDAPKGAEGCDLAMSSASLPPHRLVPRDQIHLTLRFIEDTDPRDLDAIETSVERAARAVGPLSIAPGRLVTLPHRGSARLLAAIAPASRALEELHRRLARRLSRRGREETRPFLPHFTLLRFRSPAAGLRVDRRLEDPEALEFRVGSVSLIRSVLAPDGARHREIASFPLGNPGSRDPLPEEGGSR